MFVFWSGYGIAVPFIVFTALIGTQAVVDALLGEGTYTAEVRPKFVATVLAVVALGALAKWATPSGDRVLADEETGERVVVEGRAHSFMFVPVRYWPAIVFVVGAAAIATSL